MYENNKRLIKRNLITFFLLVLLAGIQFLFLSVKAEAASGITVSEINYIDSTITLKVNDGDTAVYFSDSKKTDWEAVPGEINSDHTITMDISWIPTDKNYVLTFKANKSTEIISVTLPKLIANFKAIYNKVTGGISFRNSGIRTIEWRKKDSTTWNIVNANTIATELGYLNANGAVIYFRLAPSNGTGISSVGYRASAKVEVTIPKKTSAPAITVNGSAFSIAVKKGIAYRTVYSNGTASDWINIASTTDLLLKNIAAKAMYQTAPAERSEVSLQFRTNATSSSQVSNIFTVTIPVQEGPPDVDAYGISLSYTSSSSIALKVKAASSTVPFEYTVVKANEELNYQAAVWTAITSSSEVSLSKTKAPAGSHIFVRKKSVNSVNDDNFALASVETEITGTNGVSYPNAPSISSLTTLITTAGVCNGTNSAGYLTFQQYCPTSTTVSDIRFIDSYGLDKGSVTYRSTVARNNNSKGDSDKYIITTKIISTANLDSFVQEKLYAKITLANSDVITSSDTAGIILYLYPCTVLNNPTGEANLNNEYTNSFRRIYMSNDVADKSSFKFKLDLGTAKVPSYTVIDSFTTSQVAVNTLQYNGYTLANGNDYTVEYGSYVNDDGETIATATITVKVSNFEKALGVNITDTAEPLRITLNNGEVLNENIFITMVKTATLNDVPMASTFTEGSLQETKTSTITNSDGTKTTVTEEVISYKLILTMFDKKYSVAVSDVTWGGISILGSTTISNGTVTINLSNAKINKLTTDSSTTNNMVITLSNGYTITSGYKLTILNKPV